MTNTRALWELRDLAVYHSAAYAEIMARSPRADRLARGSMYAAALWHWRKASVCIEALHRIEGSL